MRLLDLLQLWFAVQSGECAEAFFVITHDFLSMDV
jgi:hypothetical protein